MLTTIGGKTRLASSGCTIDSPSLTLSCTLPMALAMAAINADATLFFGIDPDKAFDLMELDFRDGTRADAQRKLKEKIVTYTDDTNRTRTVRGIVTRNEVEGGAGGTYDVALADGTKLTIPVDRVKKVESSRQLIITTYTDIKADVVAKVVLPKWPADINRDSVQKLNDLAVGDGLMTKPADLGALLP